MLGIIAIMRAMRARSDGSVSDVADNKLNLLLSAYDVERQDQEYGTLVAMALVTVGAAFIGGALLFLNADCKPKNGCVSVSTPLLLGLPIFPLALLGFLVQNLAATLARERYILRIEREIADHTKAEHGSLSIPYYMHVSRFVWGGGGWKNLHYNLVSGLVYGSLFVIAAGFCYAVINFAGWHLGSYIALSLYGAILALELMIVIRAQAKARIEYLDKQASTLFWVKKH